MKEVAKARSEAWRACIYYQIYIWNEESDQWQQMISADDVCFMTEWSKTRCVQDEVNHAHIWYVLLKL